MMQVGDSKIEIGDDVVTLGGYSNNKFAWNFAGPAYIAHKKLKVKSVLYKKSTCYEFENISGWIADFALRLIDEIRDDRITKIISWNGD